MRILSEGLNALDADEKARPRILENMRQEYAGQHAEAAPERIRVWLVCTTEDGGRTLVYKGGATSLIPELESLSYDSETRKGRLTARLADRAGLAEAKQFVRENVSAIVCDKNVLLTAGERPPEGAKYRSLDENFTDGVLTVEFEAEE